MFYCADIDECAVHSGDCPAHSRCKNNAGSYVCVCDSGYRKEGSRCVGQLHDIHPNFANSNDKQTPDKRLLMRGQLVSC